MKIADPLIELLAIKLYEHDNGARSEPQPLGRRLTGWFRLVESERDFYRQIARGEADIAGLK